MIITTLNSPELSLYGQLNKYFPIAFDLAKKICQNIPENGKYSVDADNCYYMVQSYDAKSPFDARFESHREYIDIQIVLDGEEIIRFESKEKLSQSAEYKPDVEYFAMNKDYDSVRLCRGDMAIIYPDEPHAPGIFAEGSSGHVRKLVVKIKAK